ncbi:hypothetical protein DDB_G0282039 [Dictyostelium discoideum AX4]|uniref:Uncharacterized protein n=1 Tax=Dictyostelium discoideum TaxID=44689 RepID=Q54T21_DICDI|nr:hypothetical protein DDB_G0282039 [Dictyostelium discoideum AX4]EAL66441.1 hypothetical protein DDB_G0282039 [Dictyostelium discoideum AX4]|eukprot:XP_640430.1 hypothetical protein DDB_G0282039 [Dictyostelium discoideum AX4]
MSLFKSISSISKVNTTSANSTVTPSKLNDNQSFGENQVSTGIVSGIVSGLLFDLANVTKGLGL